MSESVKALEKKLDSLAKKLEKKGQHWHSEYENGGEIYDLWLKKKKGTDKGKFKLVVSYPSKNDFHTFTGTVEYGEKDEYSTLQTAELQSVFNKGKEQRVTNYDVSDNPNVTMVKAVSGAMMVPPNWLDMRYHQIKGKEMPTIEVSLHIPELTNNNKGERIAKKGDVEKIEMYIPLKK